MTRRLIPLALLAIAAIYLWMAWRIPLDQWSLDEPVGARTLPIIYGSLLGVFAVGMLVRGVGGVRDVGVAGAYRWWPLVVIVACVVAFALLIPYAGLWPSLVVFLATALGVLGERRLSVLIAAPLATALIGWLLIDGLLGVYIHPGAWWI